VLTTSDIEEPFLCVAASRLSAAFLFINRHSQGTTPHEVATSSQDAEGIRISITVAAVTVDVSSPDQPFRQIKIWKVMRETARTSCVTFARLSLKIRISNTRRAVDCKLHVFRCFANLNCCLLVPRMKKASICRKHSNCRGFCRHVKVNLLMKNSFLRANHGYTRNVFTRLYILPGRHLNIGLYVFSFCVSLLGNQTVSPVFQNLPLVMIIILE